MEVTMIMTIVMTMIIIVSPHDDNNKDNWQMMTMIVFITIGKGRFLETSEFDLQSLIFMHMTMLSG